MSRINCLDIDCVQDGIEYEPFESEQKWLDYEHFDCVHLIRETLSKFDFITEEPFEQYYCSHFEILKINPPCPCRFRSCDLRDIDPWNMNLLPVDNP